MKLPGEKNNAFATKPQNKQVLEHPPNSQKPYTTVSSLFIETLEIDTLVGLGMPQMAKSPGFSIQLYILNMKTDQGVPEAMHNLSTHPEHT